MLECLKTLCNPAGGIRYHLKEFFYGDNIWAPFKGSISEFLLNWKPNAKKLVILGASGGYMLPSQFLGQFETIIAIDPDPFAEIIFRRRHRNSEIHWIKEDLIVSSSGQAFVEFLDLHSDCALLFSGFLGQLKLLTVNDKKFQDIKKRIANKVLGDKREWASFHDRVSGDQKPTISSPLRGFPGRLQNSEIIKFFYSSASEGTELGDHITEGFFNPRLPHFYCSWELQPGWFHLIETVKASPSQQP